MKTISLQQAALTGAFFMDGVHEASGTQPGHAWNLNPLLVAWTKGFYEFVEELTQYADFCWGLGEAGGAVCEFPGVWDYEVSTEFGKWFALFVLENGGKAPTKDQCRIWLLNSAEAFFKQGVKGEIEGLPEALMRVELRK